MIQIIDPGKLPKLDDYARVAQLTRAVAELRSEASALMPRLRDRRVWMINSTAQGGGVAEMLPRIVSFMNELGLNTRWVVIAPTSPAFFNLTKRLHNLIHGTGDPHITTDDRVLYDDVSRELADQLKPMLAEGDILLVHDPQPAGVGGILRRERGVSCVWRCHIGLDLETPQTRAAWEFLRPRLEPYDHYVFSAPEYIPTFLSGRVSIIYPAIDPLSHKNRELSTHKLVGILANARLVPEHHPVLTDPFEHPTLRLQPDGSFGSALSPEDVGLLYRPIVTQISRWDKLKGWPALLAGFVELKQRSGANGLSERARRAIELSRLVLAGPEPAAVRDDPEAASVLAELIAEYRRLDDDLKRHVAILSLPMSSRKLNALIVNALQRCSSVVVQNSLREGFGLTVTEAMWKRVGVLGTTTCGIRHQLRHDIDGILNSHPEDPVRVADALQSMLIDPGLRLSYAQSAQRRVYDEFLVFAQVAKWFRVLAETAAPSYVSPAAEVPGRASVNSSEPESGRARIDLRE